MRTDRGSIDSVRQGEPRVQTGSRILRLNIVLHKQLQHEARDLNIINGNGVHVNDALPLLRRERERRFRRHARR